jgi:NAD(P)H-nitrite reductase large subunit
LQGVDLRLGVSVVDWTRRADGTVGELHLSDDTRLAPDVVVVAVGAAPDTRWLTGSGLDIADGVLCDAMLIAAPGVVAAGDVARWVDFAGVSRRLEHWDNAVFQAEHAARSLLAGPDAASTVGPYAHLPWFWSDQFGRKLQVYGSTEGAEEVVVSDGSMEEGRFVAIYRRGDRLVAALAFGSSRRAQHYRGLLQRGECDWTTAAV